MNKFRTILFLATLFFTSCIADENTDACPDLELSASNISNIEDYKIIESVLNKQFNSSSVFQISQESLSEYLIQDFTPYIDNSPLQLDSTILDNYMTLNSSLFNWGELFSEKQDLRNQEELECHFLGNANDGWTDYYAKYKDSIGYLKFGRPVQNTNGEAIVIYHHYCGIWCASGYFASLKKEDGKWVVQENRMTWES